MSTRNKVWIELEKPRDDAHALQVCAAANRMLARLNAPDAPACVFGWDDKRKAYTYGNEMGTLTLVDRGEWFNLDYFGRE